MQECQKPALAGGGGLVWRRIKTSDPTILRQKRIKQTQKIEGKKGR